MAFGFPRGYGVDIPKGANLGECDRLTKPGRQASNEWRMTARPPKRGAM